MSRSVLVQLVLLEVAVAGVLVGLAEEGLWLPVGVAVAVVCLVLLLPWRRRSLYRSLRSSLGMRARRRALRGSGIASLVGGTYEVVTVPRGSGGVSVGAVRDAATWTVALGLPLQDVFNEDPPVPVDGLVRLLTVEDVPLSSVRVVTLLSPPTPGGGQAPGLRGPVSRLVTRFMVLTLDTRYAAEVISRRGGSAAVQQVLRRCVLRAEEVMNGAGVVVRRLPASSVEMHNAGSLGPLPPGPDGQVPPAREHADHVAVGGSASMTFALRGSEAVAHVDHLAASLAAPVVATTVAVQPGPPPHRVPVTRVLVRVTGPEPVVRDAARALEGMARERGLSMDRLTGEQVPELRATMLLGVPAGVA
ncbi:type VII secretion protein EccE [Nocardioides litoris]|uniref:type VII secretion protein EccE n=1 Tax=Nocardioides litoris TaxID=1926648 RepID=UPI00111E6A1C|nr:type VII secretion protein EccE [Nocardioides litoris]